MKSQAKAIANYSLLISELASDRKRGYCSNKIMKRYADELEVEIIQITGDTDMPFEHLSDRRFYRIVRHCRRNPEIRYVLLDYRSRFAYNEDEFEERIEPFKKLGVKVVFMYDYIPNLDKEFRAIVEGVMKGASHE